MILKIALGIILGYALVWLGVNIYYRVTLMRLKRKIDESIKILENLNGDANTERKNDE